MEYLVWNIAHIWPTYRSMILYHAYNSATNSMSFYSMYVIHVSIHVICVHIPRWKSCYRRTWFTFWWVCQRTMFLLNEYRQGSICTNPLRYLHDCAMMCHVKILCAEAKNQFRNMGKLAPSRHPFQGPEPGSPPLMWLSAACLDSGFFPYTVLRFSGIELADSWLGTR